MSVDSQRYTKTFPAGSVIFREGELGSEMYVVQSGRVRISRSSRDQEKVLAELGPGEFLGEMAILSSRPRTATATVIEDAQVLAIDARTFEVMVRSNAEIAVRLLKKYAERLEEADAQIENLLLRDPTSRVVHHFAWLARTRSRVDEAGAHIEVHVGLLPAYLGVEEAKVEEVLAQMRRARICLPEPGGFVIPQVKQLHDWLELLKRMAAQKGA